MKFILIFVAIVFLALFDVFCAAKLFDPVGSKDVNIHWEFPLIAIFCFSIIEILTNQENIIYLLKNK